MSEIASKQALRLREIDRLIAEKIFGIRPCNESDRPLGVRQWCFSSASRDSRQPPALREALDDFYLQTAIIVRPLALRTSLSLSFAIVPVIVT